MLQDVLLLYKKVSLERALIAYKLYAYTSWLNTIILTWIWEVSKSKSLWKVWSTLGVVWYRSWRWISRDI